MMDNVSRYSHVSIDKTFYIRLIEACNMYCQHCFIPNNPSRIRKDVFEDIPSILKMHSSTGQTLLVQFHGGEPTLYGVNNVRNLIEHILNQVTDRNIIFSIQTNLLTLNNAWIELYKEYFGSEVGVSWDYRIRFLKKDNTSSNHEYETVFWDNFDNLLSAGLNPYLVVTTTKPFFDRFGKGLELFEFMNKRNVKQIHLERLTYSGNAVSNWDALGVTNHEYSLSMSRLFNAYIKWQSMPDKEVDISVSPFDELLSSFRSGNANNNTCWSGKCDHSFHTIDVDGYKNGCTAITSNNSIDLASITSIRNNRKTNCSACEFKKMCSSGCIENPMYDSSNECAGSYNFLKTISMYVEKEAYHEKQRHYQ